VALDDLVRRIPSQLNAQRGKATDNYMKAMLQS
jgi:hypothetical protein